MKKISILGLCSLVALGASAQVQVMKDAEKAMKGNKPFTEVVSIMTPAFTDPATKDNVDVYYIPGKAAFSQYDKLLGLKQLGQIKEADAAQMPMILLGGYEYFTKALPLDSIPDEKGKVKAKRSKDMLSAMGAHVNDLVGAGLDAFNAEKFDDAYKAWMLYVTLPSNPQVAKHMVVVPADSTRSDVAYNAALAAFRNEEMHNAIEAFKMAEYLGYNGKQLYDYAISIATQIEDQASVNYFAERAIPLYGAEDPNYIGYIINGYINSGDYKTALSLIDDAIAGNPNNAQYYVIKGILLEQEGSTNPTDLYKKAADLDPQNKMALYHYGRMLYNKANEIYDAAPTGGEAFHNVFENDFKPVMLEAVKYLEAAYDVDNDYKDPLKLLENAYYLLNDEAKMVNTQNRLKW